MQAFFWNLTNHKEKDNSFAYCIVDGASVRVVNSAVYALERIQEQMKRRAKDAGFLTEEDIAEWISMTRKGESHNEGDD